MRRLGDYLLFCISSSSPWKLSFFCLIQHFCWELTPNPSSWESLGWEEPLDKYDFITAPQRCIPYSPPRRHPINPRHSKSAGGSHSCYANPLTNVHSLNSHLLFSENQPYSQPAPALTVHLCFTRPDKLKCRCTLIHSWYSRYLHRAPFNVLFSEKKNAGNHNHIPRFCTSWKLWKAYKHHKWRGWWLLCR